MIWFLQIAVSLIFFANKTFVLAKIKVGWLLGAIAAFLAFFYFLLIGLYVYTVLEIGLMVLMGYGFVKKKETSPEVEMWIRFGTIGVMLLLAIFAFSGFITVVELVSSVCLLWSTYFILHDEEKLGWMIGVVAHSLAAILGYNKSQDVFMYFQIASAIVSLAGAMKKE